MASSIKNEKVYTELRNQGDSKEKAARIANASAARGSSNVGRKGGKSGSYDDWTVPELKKRAKQLGISGYCQRRPKIDPFTTGWFLGGVATLL